MERTAASELHEAHSSNRMRVAPFATCGRGHNVPSAARSRPTAFGKADEYSLAPITSCKVKIKHTFIIHERGEKTIENIIISLRFIKQKQLEIYIADKSV